MTIDQQIASHLNHGDTRQAIALANKLEDGLPKTRLLVTAHIMSGEPEDIRMAVKLLHSWHLERPADPEALQRLVETSLYRQHMEDAEKWLRKLRSQPGSTIDPRYYEAVMEQLKGRHRNALAKLTEIEFGRLSGNRSATQTGTLANLMARVDAAMQLANIAGGYYPGSPGPDNLAMLDHYTEQKMLEQALTELEKQLDPQPGKLRQTALAPDQKNRISNAWYNLGCYKMPDFDRLDSCLAHFEQAIKISPGHLPARINHQFMLNYSSSHSPDELFLQHRDNGQWISGLRKEPEPDFSDQVDPDRPIRIAYLSSDFRRHSVAHFILPVLRQHSSGQFRITIYHNHRTQDEYTALIKKASDHFFAVHDLDDDALHRKIRQDRIDILVELNGMTGNHRMSLVARRNAPIQLSWLGYPNTTGLANVDYRIVDRVTDPEEDWQNRMVETPLYLPDVFSVYLPPDDLPEPVPAPSFSGGPITFGSFNNLPKLNSDLLRSWAEILLQVEDSNLLIKNMQLSYEGPRERIAARFQSLGIPKNRIRFAGRTESMRQHLEHYQSVDICLDSFPYNGTTTTCDSLIMGVPVVTRYGDDHRSRVGLSQLKTIGMGSLATGTEKGYIDAAAGLANNPDLLVRVRSGLRQRMEASALMDSARFTGQLESSFRQIWRRWCERYGNAG
jgi:predicted O-linked N-acetylglucosamine transferase (SPINDLY family)